MTRAIGVANDTLQPRDKEVVATLAPGAARTSFRAVSGVLPVAGMLGAIALAVAAAASLVHIDKLVPSVCVFKAATGWPCFTCGGTRAAMRLVSLDLAGALAMNPLVAVGLLGLIPWALVDGALALRGQALVLQLGRGLGSALKWLAVPLVLGNWAYLVAVGR